MPTNNPSVHYIDAGKLAPIGVHKLCEVFWANIKAQHSHIYGSDSAYNFSVCNEHGIRQTGRGWDRDSAANGQQDGVDYNPGSRALVMLVGGDDILSSELKQGIADFANESLSRGMEKPLKAHSDFVATTCCGDNGRAAVKEYNDGVVPKPATKGEKDMMYATVDNGVQSYYRDAAGILVKLLPEEAAAYYPAIVDGDVAVVGLGGGLAALAFNERTKQARKAAGV